MAQERRWAPTNFFLDNVVRLLTAVSCCMLLVIVMIKLSPRFLYNGGAMLPYRLPNVLLTDTEEQLFFTRVMNAAANAFLLLGLVIIATVLMVALYYYRYYNVIGAWITLACAVNLAILPVPYIDVIFKEYNVPADIYSVGFFVYNFVALGVVVIRWKGPLLLQQCYLTVQSAFMSLVLLKFLPTWTLWVMLCLLIIWDLVAVLTVVGPLRVLVETVKQRNESMQSLHSGMLFSTFSSQSGSDGQKRQGIKLGLGDFVFYSVLVGKVATFGDCTILCACFVGVLVGLCVTTFAQAMLANKRKAMPALPVSLSLGLTFVASHKAIQNFMNELYVSQALI